MKEENKRNTIGYKLRRIRLMEDVAQKDLAFYIDKPQSSVVIFERQSNPKINTISEYLGGMGMTAELVIKKGKKSIATIKI